MRPGLFEHHGASPCDRCLTVIDTPVCRRCFTLSLFTVWWTAAFVFGGVTCPAWVGLAPLASVADWAVARQAVWYSPGRAWLSSAVASTAIGATLSRAVHGRWWAPATPWVALWFIVITSLLVARRLRVSRRSGAADADGRPPAAPC